MPKRWKHRSRVEWWFSGVESRDKWGVATEHVWSFSCGREVNSKDLLYNTMHTCTNFIVYLKFLRRWISWSDLNKKWFSCLHTVAFWKTYDILCVHFWFICFLFHKLLNLTMGSVFINLAWHCVFFLIERKKNFSSCVEENWNRRWLQVPEDEMLTWHREIQFKNSLYC